MELRESCSECRIVLDTLVTLGDRSGPGVIESDYNGVAVDRHGRYFVLGQETTTIKVFSPEGEFLTSIGRRGQGPGEFLWPQALETQPDGRLWVLDLMNARVSIFSSELDHEKSVPVRGITPGFALLPLPGDSILLSGYGLTPELFGHAVHVLSPDGILARSFGAPRHMIVSRDPRRLLRHVARGRTGDLWIASLDRFQVERWTLAGELREVLTREVPIEGWFSDPDVDLNATLNSIQEDSEGRLWVKLNGPKPGRSTGSLDRSTVIEVVDLADGTVMASSPPLAGSWSRLFGDRHMAKTIVDLEQASVEVLVVQARVRRER